MSQPRGDKSSYTEHQKRQAPPPAALWRSGKKAAAARKRRAESRARLLDRNPRITQAFRAHQREQNCGIRRMQPDTAARGRAAKSRDMRRPVNGEIAVVEDRVRHRSIVVECRPMDTAHVWRCCPLTITDMLWLDLSILTRTSARASPGDASIDIATAAVAAARIIASPPGCPSNQYTHNRQSDALPPPH
jgi:hypothetical protein